MGVSAELGRQWSALVACVESVAASRQNVSNIFTKHAQLATMYVLHKIAAGHDRSVAPVLSLGIILDQCHVVLEHRGYINRNVGK
jgi:hypothetical protein